MGEEGKMPRVERERSSIVRYERLSSEFSSKYTDEHSREKTQGDLMSYDRRVGNGEAGLRWEADLG